MYLLLMRFFFFLFISLSGISVFAQGNSKTEALKKIKTVEQAEAFIKKLDTKSGSIGRFNAIVDSTEYKEISKNYKAGDIFFGKRSTYKLLEKEQEIVYRCQYIYLDGNQFSKEKIDSLRNEILTKFKSGTSFKTLSDLYSMDGNKKGGDLGWFHKEKMGAEFGASVAEHAKGQIFTCDADSKKAYYVILKTHIEMPADSWVYINLH